MKKLVLLLASLFLLGGCTQEFVRESTYTPTGGADYNPDLDPDLNGGGSGSGEQGGGEQGGEGQGGGEQGGGEQTPDEGDEELMCTYNIYFSYSHTTKYNSTTKKDEDCPILSFEAPMLKPLGQVPEAIAGTNGAVDEAKVRALGTTLGFTVDPAFPNFLGFSFHGLCLDSSDIWDFTKDYKQLAVVTLYGIWYSTEA